MHILPEDPNRPKGPHLVLVTGPGIGQGLPPGVMFLAVFGPAKHEQMPIVLSGVDKHGIKFKCGCGQAHCTREAVMKWKGRHPPFAAQGG